MSVNGVTGPRVDSAEWRRGEREDMKLGDVLRKEREQRGGSMRRIEEVWTDMRPLSMDAIKTIEAGEHQEFEAAAALIAAYSKAFEIPVGQMFYPCGLPFQDLDDYRYETR